MRARGGRLRLCPGDRGTAPVRGAGACPPPAAAPLRPAFAARCVRGATRRGGRGSRVCARGPAGGTRRARRGRRAQRCARCGQPDTEQTAPACAQPTSSGGQVRATPRARRGKARGAVAVGGHGGDALQSQQRLGPPLLALDAARAQVIADAAGHGLIPRLRPYAPRPCTRLVARVDSVQDARCCSPTWKRANACAAART